MGQTTGRLDGSTLDAELALALGAARRAGDSILEVYRSGDYQVERKQGGDPVGIADKLANRHVCSVIVEAFPSHGLLTEELVSEREIGSKYRAVTDAIARRREATWTWFVDPLDGTKDFLEGTGDFGVHVGLCFEGRPVLGVNHYPLHQRSFWAVRGRGAWCEDQGGRSSIRVSSRTETARMVMLCSRTSYDPRFQWFAEDLDLVGPQRRGGMGLKLMEIANGRADVYLVLNDRCHLWDACSGQAILEEAGGRITDLQGDAIDYRQPGTALVRGLMASNGTRHSHLLAAALALG